MPTPFSMALPSSAPSSPFLSYRRPDPVGAERRRRQRVERAFAAFRRLAHDRLNLVAAPKGTVATLRALLEQEKPVGVPLRVVLRDLLEAEESR